MNTRLVEPLSRPLYLSRVALQAADPNQKKKAKAKAKGEAYAAQGGPEQEKWQKGSTPAWTAGGWGSESAGASSSGPASSSAGSASSAAVPAAEAKEASTAVLNEAINRWVANAEGLKEPLKRLKEAVPGGPRRQRKQFRLILFRKSSRMRTTRRLRSSWRRLLRNIIRRTLVLKGCGRKNDAPGKHTFARSCGRKRML